MTMRMMKTMSKMMSQHTLTLAWLGLGLAVITLVGCGDGGDTRNRDGDGDGNGNQARGRGEASRELVVYSGRSRSLVEPIIENFENQHDIDVKVRDGKDAQLLATLREEGAQSPADVLWLNTAGALGAAAEAGLLAELPEDILEKPGAFHSSSGRWTPVTARFRVLAYNPNEVSEDELPASVLELPNLEQFQGRIGWTPTYSSFQDFVTALRLTEGRDVARQWLTQMKALSPKAYPSNTPMLQALAAGEIDIALTNHYYVHRLQQSSEDGEAAVAIHHFEPGDTGNLALVTGAGILKQSDNPELAQQFIEHLLSAESQEFAATSVHEYPVITDVELPEHLLPMQRVLTLSPQLDFERLGRIDQTLSLMREVGLF